MSFKTISLIILIVGSIVVIFELFSGTARLRGGVSYRRSEETGKYWFAVLFKAAVAFVVFWILRYW